MSEEKWKPIPHHQMFHDADKFCISQAGRAVRLEPATGPATPDQAVEVSADSWTAILTLAAEHGFTLDSDQSVLGIQLTSNFAAALRAGAGGLKKSHRKAFERVLGLVNELRGLVISEVH